MVDYREIKLKTLNDKFTILINEILNFISVANYMYKDRIENLHTEVGKILKENNDKIIQKDIEKGRYKIGKFKINYEGEVKELKTAIYTLLSLLKRAKYGLDYVNNYKKVKTQPINDLILFSFLEEIEIRNILSNLNVISKLLKFRRENAQQIYIPSSLLHRRYRLYNNQKFMNDIIYNKVKNFIHSNSHILDMNEKEDIKFLLTSDYDIGENIDSQNSHNLTLIKGSFFWRELFRFQPIIFHEIGHIIQYFLKGNIRNKYNSIIEKIFIISNNDNEVDIFSLEDLRRLRDEIFADVISIYILGDAYIVSLVIYGLLGLHFYKTFSDLEHEQSDIYNIKGEKIDYKYVYYRYQDLGIRFNPRREKHILRLIILLELRDLLKLKKNFKNKFFQEYNDFFDNVKLYISDLFPFYGHGASFMYSNIDNKETLENITHYINFLVNEFIEFINANFDFKNSDEDEYGGGIYICEEDFLDIKSENEMYVKYYIHDKESNNFFKVMINLNDYGSDIKIVSVKKEEVLKKSNLKSMDIYNLMWKVAFTQLSKINSEKESLLGRSLKDGRVFGVYQITRYKPYADIVNSYLKKFRGEINLNVGFIGFIKGKNFYSGKTIKESIEEFIKNLDKNNITNYMMGPHDLFVYRITHTKRIEDDIYIPLIEKKAFMDTHSILLIEKDKNHRESQDITLIDKLWAFSFGWEDLILCEEGLNNIFSLKSYLQNGRNDFGIERTETLISYLPLEKDQKRFISYILVKLNKKDNRFNEEINTKQRFTYNTLINIRVKNRKNINIEVEKLPNRQNFHYNFVGYQFPGRYDLIILSEKNLQLGDIQLLLHEITNAQLDKLVPSLLNKNENYEIEDVVIDIIGNLE